MPIDRGPWNALIDDDGSNLVGTIWNKDKIKTTILDPADAGLGWISVGNSEVGTLTNWTPGLGAGHTLILWTGASDARVLGLVGGSIATLVTIKNRGSGGIVRIAHNNGTTTGAKFYNIASSNDTPIAFDGAVTYIKLGDGHWYLVSQEQGAWITPAFSAADYAAPTGTWTVGAGNVQTCKYRLSGRTLHVALQVDATSITGTPAYLTRTIPGGFVSGMQATPLIQSGSAGVFAAGMCTIPVSGTLLQLYATAAAGAWSASSANAYVRAVLMFEVT